MAKKLKIVNLKDELAALDMTIRRDSCGGYLINFKGATARTQQYANDVYEAIATAREMAKDLEEARISMEEIAKRVSLGY